MDNWEIYYRTHAKGVGKELTGSPPLTFVSNGEPLADYRIYGNIGGVGDRTGNLIDVSQEKLQNVSDTSATKRYGVLTEPLPQGVYTFFYNSPIDLLSYRIVINGVYSDYQTVESNVLNKINLPQYAQFFVYNGLRDATFADRQQTNIQLYSYKIPIVCGETTTNIYLDEPLGENESISMSDTGVSIPTINGSNTLSIGTTVQPSKMYIKYGGSNVNQSLMKYLEYKYKFAKE